MSSCVQAKGAKDLGATIVTPVQNLSVILYDVIFPPQSHISQEQPDFHLKYANNVAMMFQALHWSCSSSQVCASLFHFCTHSPCNKTVEAMKVTASRTDNSSPYYPYRFLVLCLLNTLSLILLEGRCNFRKPYSALKPHSFLQSTSKDLLISDGQVMPILES